MGKAWRVGVFILGIVVLLGIVWSVNGTVRSDAAPVSFASKETVSVHFTSKGCFHDERVSMTFRDGVVRLGGGKRRLELTPAELATLDAYFETLRSGTDAWCTTEIDYTLSHGSKLRSMSTEEHLGDDACLGMNDGMLTPQMVADYLGSDDEIPFWRPGGTEPSLVGTN